MNESTLNEYVYTEEEPDFFHHFIPQQQTVNIKSVVIRRPQGDAVGASKLVEETLWGMGDSIFP